MDILVSDVLFICNNKEGFLSLINEEISLNLENKFKITFIYLFYTKSILAFSKLYLKVTFYRTISSGAEMKSSVNISRNLYSKFSIKSNLA